jgi:hypothetical protein
MDTLISGVEGYVDSYLHPPNPYVSITWSLINPLNAELNPICHLLALLGAHLIFHVSKIRVKQRDIILSDSDIGDNANVSNYTRQNTKPRRIQ